MALARLALIFALFFAGGGGGGRILRSTIRKPKVFFFEALVYESRKLYVFSLSWCLFFLDPSVLQEQLIRQASGWGSDILGFPYGKEKHGCSLVRL